MTIEVREKGSMTFYEEVVSIAAQYQRLVRDPNAKLRNIFGTMRGVIIAMVVMFVINLILGVTGGFSGLTIAALLLLAVAVAAVFIYRNALMKVVRGYMEDTRISLVTLDEEGVELNKEGSQVMRMAWDRVAFVRVFSESVCFVSKDVMGFVIAVNRLHEGEILGYLRENGTTVRIIEG